MTPDSADFYLGLDGGGSTTRARLVDAGGAVLGEGRSGPSNLGLGAGIAESAIGQAVDHAFAQAGLAVEQRARTAAGFGFASADIQGLPMIDTTTFGFLSVAVASDAVAAYLGAHFGGDGAILILGTGSQGVAIIGQRTVTLGGWGFHIGDQGSGAILGRAGLRAAVLAHEGLAPASPFTREAMRRFGDSLDRAYVWALTAEAGDYAAFAPMLIDHAGRGDPVAHAILRHGLAWVEMMVRRLAGLGAARICLMGGLASTYMAIVDPSLRDYLAAPGGDAMDGAILLARRGGVAG